MVPKQKGSWRFVLNLTTGFDFEGGHDEHRGLDASGSVIDVPLHKHRVSLDFTRIAPAIQYTFSDGWDVWLRLPYDIKDQSVDIGLVEPATAAEQESIKRNAQLHHRDESYEGFSDLKLLVARWRSGVFKDNAVLEIAFGTSLPAGQTETDPFKAGDAGEEHLHIQFGTGTFDPLLEGYYAVPLPGSFVFRGYALGRFPLYENSKSHRAPVEVTSGLSLGRHELLPRLSLRGVYSFFLQGYGHWDGTRDPNSGLLSHSVVLGATVNLPGRSNLGLGWRYPFAQRTLSNQGDAFEQGPTFLFAVMYPLDP